MNKRKNVYVDSNICMEQEMRMWQRDTYMEKEKRYVYEKRDAYL